uniref:Multivesicular body subunit 12A n=1 Tax=Latimeria chalumnae TaxID=7897 RepID=H3B8T8_LATCH
GPPPKRILKKTHLASNLFLQILAAADGSSANFGKGFGQKSNYYLCCSSLSVSENCQGEIVADLKILTDKSSLPPGYSYVAEFLEGKASISKKKRLCLKVVPVNSTDTALFDIQLTGKSKQILPSYTCIGELSGFFIWYKKGQVLCRPVPKPRNINVDMKGLSLETQDSSNNNLSQTHLRPMEEMQPAKVSKRRSTLERQTSAYDTSNIYGISAMDGVPFALHPKFDLKNDIENVLISSITGLRFKSQTEIENEYNYNFATENTAAARNFPVVH